MINLLEEGETSELETLKTKKFLNENLNRIRKMLVEEGALEGVKQHLGDNWGKYLAGAGALGAGALGADAAMDAGYGQGLAGIAGSGMPMGDQAEALGQLAGAGADQAGAAIGAGMDQAGAAIGAGADQAGAAIAGAADQAGQFVTDAAGNIKDAAGNVVGNVQDLMGQGAPAPVA